MACYEQLDGSISCTMRPVPPKRRIHSTRRLTPMADIDDSEKRDYGLLPDEERHLMAECARLGSWPRTVTIERTGTVYEIPNRRKAQRLLQTLGIEDEK